MPHENNSVLVWDILVRVFHWSLGFFFVLAYFSVGESLSLHAHAGYTVALLVLFRIVWGVIGSPFARFKEFVVWPRESLRYFYTLLQRRPRSYLGHNPAAAAMIIGLLCSLFLTAISGIVLFALEGSGPLANTFVVSWPGSLVADAHEYSANLSVAFIAIHVLGVLYSSYVEQQNLSKSMITGYKKKQRDEE